MWGSPMIMPAGYMTLVDSAYSLLKFWSDDTFGTDTRKIEDAIKEITALLGGEVIKSVGWDSITGELIPIPAAVFRKINGIDIVGERKVILISSSDDKNQIAVIPIIDAYEFIGTFKCLMPTIINFDPSEWNFTAQSVSPALDIKNNDSMEYVSFKKAGRPRKHDWDKFFHEVVNGGHKLYQMAA